MKQIAAFPVFLLAVLQIGPRGNVLKIITKLGK